MWDCWPYQRIGARTYMRSTFDRTGGNDFADASHFLYQESDKFNVSLDVGGPGILYFVRYNRWHGSPWHWQVDGKDHVVAETSSEDPTQPWRNAVWIPEKVFPPPLALTWGETQGADLSWVPIPFERSFRMAYARTCYGTGYYIFTQYMKGIELSQPITTWTGTQPPAKDVLKLLKKAGTDLLSSGAGKASRETALPEAHGKLGLKPFQTRTVATLTTAPSMLRALEFSIPRSEALTFGQARLKVTWDGNSQPSIDAPLALFFGTGTLYNRDNRKYLVKAFPMNVTYQKDRVYLACYFPMPFFSSARIELTNNERAGIRDIRWSARLEPYEGPPNHVAYFHATYTDHPKPEPGRALPLLDTNSVEGGGPWSGSFVGTSFIFSHEGILDGVEGDPRFWLDESLTPQAQGTGTEEWGGGGSAWEGGRITSLPFAGHPVGCRNPAEAKNPEDKIESAYRFLLSDLFPFGRRARIALEHGGTNNVDQHYETVAYWYGVPSPTLIQSDTLTIGNKDSELAHKYVSPSGGKPYSIESRYEWGVDTLDGREMYPTQKKTGRITTGTTEFTARIDSRNLGVLLRRTLDYAYPDQRAEVYVKDAADSDAKWEHAGTWYTAGSDLSVFSYPLQELGATQHVPQVSNRRFRDEEFMIPRDLTRNRSAIKVKFEFKPITRPVFPNYPTRTSAWSEIQYQVYCFHMPRITSW